MYLYGLKNCDTCRKALKTLRDVTLVDVREDGLPQEVLTRAVAQFGGELVNMRSTTWRTLTEAEKAMHTQELMSALIRAHPTVMKRPLIVSKDAMYLGWTPEVREALGVA